MSVKFSAQNGAPVKQPQDGDTWRKRVWKECKSEVEKEVWETLSSSCDMVVTLTNSLKPWWSAQDQADKIS